MIINLVAEKSKLEKQKTSKAKTVVLDNKEKSLSHDEDSINKDDFDFADLTNEDIWVRKFKFFVVN